MKEKVKVILTVEIDKENKELIIEGILDNGIKITFNSSDIIRVYSNDYEDNGQSNPKFTC